MIRIVRFLRSACACSTASAAEARRALDGAGDEGGDDRLAGDDELAGLLEEVGEPAPAADGSEDEDAAEVRRLQDELESLFDAAGDETDISRELADAALGLYRWRLAGSDS